MLPNNKVFIVWVLDGLRLCEDVIRWEILSWLVDYEVELIERYGVRWRKKYLNKCFSWCCEMGYLDVVKWLWRVGEDGIDIHTRNENVFRLSCLYGHLNVVKWLWEVGDGKIDIHARNECAFRWSCVSGHLDVVKWLWKVSNGSIDKKVIDNVIHKNSCENIVNYLKSNKIDGLRDVKV